MKKCGLLGNNIGYSLSPVIHNDYYMKQGIELNYELFDINEYDLSNFIKNLNSKNVIGFNVTIPYKQTIIKYLNKIEYPADRIGAVNTVLVQSGYLTGFNTDYYGFIKSIEDYNIDLTGKHGLIIGSGGAAKCVACALYDLKCKSIDIITRNTHKNMDYFNSFCNILKAKKDDYLSKYDIIINCTPLGGINYIDMIPINLEGIKNQCIVYDLVYNPKKTRLLIEAEKQGVLTINGESMLKYQAYKAADIWIEYIKTKD